MEIEQAIEAIKALKEQKASIEAALKEICGAGIETASNGKPASPEPDIIAKAGEYVVVCTEFRGVFFGRAESDIHRKDTETILAGIRNCIYWPTEQGGFGGLLSDGPHAKARIGATIPRGLIKKVTFAGPVSAKGVSAWLSAPTHK